MAVCGGTARAGGQSAVLGGLQSACRRAGWATHVQRPRRLVSPAAPGAVGGRSAARRRPWVCRKECSDNECSLSPPRCAGRQAGRPARAHTGERTEAAPRWQPAGCEQSRASLPALGAADAAPCATPTSRPGTDRPRVATLSSVSSDHMGRLFETSKLEQPTAPSLDHSHLSAERGAGCKQCSGVTSMADEEEATLFSARASAGGSAAPGVASLTKTAVLWRPDDPKAAACRSLEVEHLAGACC